MGSIVAFQEKLQRELLNLEKLLHAENFRMVQQQLEDPLDWLLFPLPASWSFEKIIFHHSWLQRAVATYKQVLL
jgi:hypothetical protein